MNPEPGTAWRHRHGQLIRVEFLTNLDDTAQNPKTVVFRSQDDNTLWSRPFSDWHNDFKFVEADRQGVL